MINLKILFPIHHNLPSLPKFILNYCMYNLVFCPLQNIHQQIYQDWQLWAKLQRYLVQKFNCIQNWIWGTGFSFLKCDYIYSMRRFCTIFPLKLHFQSKFPFKNNFLFFNQIFLHSIQFNNLFSVFPKTTFSPFNSTINFCIETAFSIKYPSKFPHSIQFNNLFLFFQLKLHFLKFSPFKSIINFLFFQANFSPFNPIQ